MTIKRAAAIALWLCCFFAASASWAGTYITDVEALSEGHKRIYLEAREILNDRGGRANGLETAGYMIDSLIASEPNFLPIYIEKARWTIMNGYDNGDYPTANKEALKIIQEIQAKDPSYPKSYVLAGHVYTNLGDYENAERSLEFATATASDDPWLYNNWADLLGRKGEYSKAVEYAEKALVLSKDNGKALVSAVYFIAKYSRRSGESKASQKIAGIVFSHFKEPMERLRIVERLIHQYSGRRETLVHANEILVRQSKETPYLPEVKLQMANLLLTQGYTSTRGYIVRYHIGFSARAEQILARIRNEDAVRVRAFKMRVRIAIGGDDLPKARSLIEQAENEGIIPQDTVLKNLAYLRFAEGNYQESIALYERSGNTSNRLLMVAYSKTGRLDKLREYHEKRVAKSPDDAWTLGNYASFLLVKLGDIDGAIEYGERAVAQMSYSLARSNLSLAYLMRASRSYKSGDTPAARESYESARAVGVDRTYLNKHCGPYCSDIKEMLAHFREGNGRLEL